jgi:hypothetical protein
MGPKYVWYRNETESHFGPNRNETEFFLGSGMRPNHILGKIGMRPNLFGPRNETEFNFDGRNKTESANTKSE